MYTRASYIYYIIYPYILKMCWNFTIVFSGWIPPWTQRPRRLDLAAKPRKTGLGKNYGFCLIVNFNWSNWNADFEKGSSWILALTTTYIFTYFHFKTQSRSQLWSVATITPFRSLYRRSECQLNAPIIAQTIPT